MQTTSYRIEDIIQRNKETGHHFFDADTLRAFRSRISSNVYQGPGGIFIVTSEQTVHFFGDGIDTRMYTPRKFNMETGEVEHFDCAPEFNTCTKSRAHTIARKAAAGEKF